MELQIQLMVLDLLWHVVRQVEGEFRARGYVVTLSKNTINRYVAHGMLGTFPLVRGYKDMMPKH